jgi:predicted dinucleotide-binding enzyme
MTASATPAPASVGTIGILGAGRVGTAVARQALSAGHRVLIAASGDPADIELIVDVMAPGAVAVTAAEAARRSDVVILSLPLRKYRSLDPDSLRGKVVIDAMNLWPETDGDIPELAASASSSEMVQAFLSDARVVKTLNHIGYHELESNGTPAAPPGDARLPSPAMTRLLAQSSWGSRTDWATTPSTRAPSAPAQPSRRARRFSMVDTTATP